MQSFTIELHSTKYCEVCQAATHHRCRAMHPLWVLILTVVSCGLFLPWLLWMGFMFVWGHNAFSKCERCEMRPPRFSPDLPGMESANGRWGGDSSKQYAGFVARRPWASVTRVEIWVYSLLALGLLALALATWAVQ